MEESKMAEPKYVIEATIRTDGTVQRKDVVGAIFGQTEGLLGESLQLRAMQRKGRIGHVDVELQNQRGKVQGIIRLPTMIDQVTTAVIAAALETIDRIGPCQANIKVQKIENVRSAKRTQVVDRAKNLLLNLVNSGAEESSSILDEVRSVLTLGTETNHHGMTCGPNAIESNALIIVEGQRQNAGRFVEDMAANLCRVARIELVKTTLQGLGISSDFSLVFDGVSIGAKSFSTEESLQLIQHIQHRRGIFSIAAGHINLSSSLEGISRDREVTPVFVLTMT